MFSAPGAARYRHMDLLQYWSQALSFLAGLAGGSLLTLKLSKSQTTSGAGGRTVSQDGARAGGDIVGGDKSTRLDR